jgi:hypothetical protein
MMANEPPEARKLVCCSARRALWSVNNLEDYFPLVFEPNEAWRPPQRGRAGIRLQGRNDVRQRYRSRHFQGSIPSRFMSSSTTPT